MRLDLFCVLGVLFGFNKRDAAREFSKVSPADESRDRPPKGGSGSTELGEVPAACARFANDNETSMCEFRAK